MDAKWQDVNNDGYPDLHLTGHWQGLATFINEGGTVEYNTPKDYFDVSEGMYNQIIFTDINEDGIQDIFLGNAGLNTCYGPGSLLQEKSDSSVRRL